MPSQRRRDEQHQQWRPRDGDGFCIFRSPHVVACVKDFRFVICRGCPGPRRWGQFPTCLPLLPRRILAVRQLLRLRPGRWPAGGLAGRLRGTPAAVARCRHGPRRLAFYHTHTSETLDIVYSEHGAYVPEALDEIHHLFRDFRTGDIHPIDPHLLDLLHDVKQVTGGTRHFEIISAYRSPATNHMLASRSNGVADHSLHLQGQAIDVRLPGVKTADLRRAALRRAGGGVGYYPDSDFVHSTPAASAAGSPRRVRSSAPGTVPAAPSSVWPRLPARDGQQRAAAAPSSVPSSCKPTRTRRPSGRSGQCAVRKPTTAIPMPPTSCPSSPSGWAATGSRTRPLPLIRSAADQGVTEAQYWLAWQSESGPELPHDPAIALGWYEKAAAGRHRLALQRLATAWERGELGLPVDARKAMEYRAQIRRCEEENARASR